MMPRRGDGFPARTLMTALVSIWALAIALTAASGPPQQGASSPAGKTTATVSMTAATTADQAANAYVGEDTCLT